MPPGLRGVVPRRAAPPKAARARPPRTLQPDASSLDTAGPEALAGRRDVTGAPAHSSGPPSAPNKALSGAWLEGVGGTPSQGRQLAGPDAANCMGQAGAKALKIRGPNLQQLR